MIGRVFTIGALFAMARQAAREAKMDEVRLRTDMAARGARQRNERAAQRRNLDQMRATSSAQVRMSLADSGVNPMLTMGGGPGGGVNAAHIQRAAANSAMSGRSLGRYGY